MVKPRDEEQHLAWLDSRRSTPVKAPEPQVFRTGPTNLYFRVVDSDGKPHFYDRHLKILDMGGEPVMGTPSNQRGGLLRSLLGAAAMVVGSRVSGGGLLAKLLGVIGDRLRNEKVAELSLPKERTDLVIAVADLIGWDSVALLGAEVQAAAADGKITAAELADLTARARGMKAADEPEDEKEDPVEAPPDPTPEEDDGIPPAPPADLPPEPPPAEPEPPTAPEPAEPPEPPEEEEPLEAPGSSESPPDSAPPEGPPEASEAPQPPEDAPSEPESPPADPPEPDGPPETPPEG